MADTHANAFLWIQITRNSNTTIELVESYINLPWRWDIVCYSLIKSIDFVKRHVGSSCLVWPSLSGNKNISLNDIESNLHLPWNWKNISSRDDITDEFVKRHADKEWDITALSERANLWEDINKNTQNYCVLSAVNNPNITIEFIERHIEIYETQDWYIRQIASMKIVTLDFIEKHLNILYGSWLSSNPNLTIEFMRKYPDEDWDMRKFSRCNPTVTPELVSNNPEFNWDWEVLSTRSNFSPREHPEFQWNWKGYSRNENFNFECVPEDKLCELDWKCISQTKITTLPQIIKYSIYINWEQLTVSEYTTMNMIDNAPEFPWCYKYVPSNPNCNLVMLDKYKEFSTFYKMAGKSLETDKEAFIERRYRKHLSAYRIQQYWNLVRTDLNYALCRKKLEEDWAFVCKTLLT